MDRCMYVHIGSMLGIQKWGIRSSKKATYLVLIQEVFTKIAKFGNKTLINQSNQMN